MTRLSDHRRKQLERLLRRCRQRVYDDRRYERIIMRVKHRSGVTVEYGQSNHMFDNPDVVAGVRQPS
jgi:hypothetical protein